MQKFSPKYRINYLYCKYKNHSDERANMIYLSQQCHENSLVCSLCLEEKHMGHQTKPLKHFLSDLQKRYAQEKNSTSKAELQNLQQSRLFLLTTIRDAVDTLAQRFAQLENQVIQKYELIKSQILQKEAKRNRFTSFYESMALQGRGDSSFQIQNYLHFEPLYAFNINGQLTKFIQSSDTTLKLIKDNLVVKKKETFELKENNTTKNQITESMKNDFIFPMSIKRNGNIFTQKNPHTKQTLGYLNMFLKKWTGKLRIKVLSLPATAKVVIGVAKIEELIASKGIYPLKNQANTFFIDNTGAALNHQYNHIASIKQGDQIFVMVKKANIKIMVNGDMCCYHLNNKQQEAFFFSLEGLCQIDMVYPYVKG